MKRTNDEVVSNRVYSEDKNKTIEDEKNVYTVF